MPKLIDLTGEVFGRLTVLERDITRKGTYWKCQCECGKIKSVLGSNLRRGVTQSCGCLQRERTGTANVHDLTGQIFGRLTVIERDNSKIGGNCYWLCKCACGNTNFISVNSCHLISGHTKSCGCLQKEKTSITQLKNRIGERYGKLVVIEQDENKKDKVYWKCLCDCGNIVSVSANNLCTGNTQSCGCQNSKGEAILSELLRELKIDFISEKSFPDLIGDTGKKLRFDFFLPNYNTCIEYQGIQHYTPVDHFGGAATFNKRKEYDQLKVSYCKEKKLRLITIPYTILTELNVEKLKEMLGSDANAN